MSPRPNPNARRQHGSPTEQQALFLAASQTLRKHLTPFQQSVLSKREAHRGRITAEAIATELSKQGGQVVTEACVLEALAVIVDTALTAGFPNLDR